MTPPPGPETSDVRTPRPRRSLTLQLTLVVAAIVVTLLAVALTAGNRFWRDTLREAIDARLSSVAESRRDVTQAHITQWRQLITLLAAKGEYRGLLGELRQGKSPAANQTFSQSSMDGFVDRGTILSGVLADATGRVLIASKGTNRDGDLADDPEFQNGLKGPHIGNPRRVGDQFEITLSAPIENFENPPKTLGVLVVTVPATPLADAVLDTTGLGQTGEVVLGVREGGKVHFLFPPRYKEDTLMFPLEDAPTMAAATRVQDTISRTRDYRGERVLAVGRTIGYGGWALAAKIDEAEAYEPITRALRYGIGLAAAVALAGLLAAWLLARRFTQPIVRLADAAESVTQGKLDITVPVTSRTEAGELTARFNEMTAALRSRTAERDASEATTRESEHFLQRITDVTPGVIHIFDLEAQRTVFINRTVASVLGYTAEEVLAMGPEVVPALMHPDDMPRYVEHMKRIRTLGDGEVSDFEHRLRDRSGEWHWFHNRGAIFTRNADGGVRMTIGTAVEITNRKRAEDALEAERCRLRTLIDVLPLSIYIKDTASRFLLANDGCARALGLATPAELLGKTDADFFPPAIAAAFLEHERRIIAGEPVVNVEEASVNPDGSARVEMTTKVTLRDSAGTVIGIVGVSRDITARKRAEEALRESEQRMRLATEATGVGIWEWNLATNAVQWDAQMFRIYGIAPTADGFVDYSQWRGAVVPEDLAEQEAVLQDTVRRSGHSSREFRIRRRDDGECRHIHAVEAVRTNAQGQAEWMVGTNRDITARKMAEEEIHRLNTGLEQRVRERTAELVASNKELEAFSYSVSHDLRAPLRAVNGFIRMLKDAYGDRLDAEGHRLIGVVASEATRMGRLIDDLLAFSRMSRQQAERRDIDMTAMARTEFENLTRAAQEAVPRLELQTLPPAHGDPAMLRQVFANLLGNAIKFTRKRPDPVIEVGGARENGGTTYYVKDNGVGFEEKYMHKLFGVFQRLHSESEFEGTGIGLALVQRIIHRHGGKVLAEGRPDAGATFYFTLPNPQEPTQ